MGLLSRAFVATAGTFWHVIKQTNAENAMKAHSRQIDHQSKGSLAQTSSKLEAEGIKRRRDDDDDADDQTPKQRAVENPQYFNHLSNAAPIRKPAYANDEAWFESKFRRQYHVGPFLSDALGKNVSFDENEMKAQLVGAVPVNAKLYQLKYDQAENVFFDSETGTVYVLRWNDDRKAPRFEIADKYDVAAFRTLDNPLLWK